MYRRTSWWLARVALCAAVLVPMAIGAQGAGAVRATKLSAGSVKSIPTDIYPTAASCPPGKAVGSETCWVIGSTSSTEFAVPVKRGAPQENAVEVDGAVAIACPSATTCAIAATESSSAELIWLVSGDVEKTVPIKDMSYPFGVACESASTCIVVGEKYTSSSSDAEMALVRSSASSASAKAVPHASELSSVACTSSSSCLAVGSTTGTTKGKAVVVRIAKGTAGKVATVKGSDSFEQLSCGSSKECWVDGTTYSSSKGVTEVLGPITSGKAGKLGKGPEYGSALGCLTATSCVYGSGTDQYGTGEALLVSKGKVVQTVKLKSFAYGPLTAVSCPTATSCLAAGPEKFHNPGADYYYTSGVVTLST